MDRTVAVRVGASLLVVLAIGVAVSTVGIYAVSADADVESAELTVEPLSTEDRQPGVDDASFAVVAVSNERIDWLEKITSEWDEGSFENCGPNTVDEFGIDRGNDNDGYETDEDITANVRETEITEDHFVAQFYEREDFGGASTHVDAGDSIVSVNVDCFGTPDEPGWYRISGTTTGSMDDGTDVEYETVSNYFWICECDDEAEARAELGPPPDEPESEPTPTPEPSNGGESDHGEDDTQTDAATDTPTSEGTETETDGEPPATDGASDAETTETPTETQPPTTASPSPAAQPTATPAGWDDHVHRSPTEGDGTGFGVVVAVVALLLTALALIRR